MVEILLLIFKAPSSMYYLVWIANTKHHLLGSFKKRNVFSQSFGDEMLQIKVSL